MFEMKLVSKIISFSSFNPYADLIKFNPPPDLKSPEHGLAITMGKNLNYP